MPSTALGSVDLSAMCWRHPPLGDRPGETHLTFPLSVWIDGDGWGFTRARVSPGAPAGALPNLVQMDTIYSPPDELDPLWPWKQYRSPLDESRTFVHMFVPSWIVAQHLPSAPGATQRLVNLRVVEDGDARVLEVRLRGRLEPADDYEGDLPPGFMMAKITVEDYPNGVLFALRERQQITDPAALPVGQMIPKEQP